jgi:hypothetical protein
MSRIGYAEIRTHGGRRATALRHLMFGRFAGRAGIRGDERHGKPGRVDERGGGL